MPFFHEDLSLPSRSAERHEPVDMMGITELEEIRLVLVGNTGSGKSSSANTMLGQRKFLAKLSASSVTRKCQPGSTDRAFDDDQKRMRKITVVDMPGFGDTHLSEEEIHTEIANCLYFTAPGPHAFLLVVPIGRYTDYEAQAVNHLAKIFGDDAVKYHTIVLFTKGDDLKGMEFDEYLKESPDGLRELIDKCGGRYHVFNNEENYGNGTQVQELMMKVDKMVKKSKTEFYTNAMFKEAEAAIREEQKRKQEMELETNNEESQPVPQSIRKRKLHLRQHQKRERKGCDRASRSTREVAPSSKLMLILRRIVAAGAVGLAVGVAFGVAVPLTAALSAHVAGSAVGLVAAKLTGASAAGAVSAVVAAASGKTALAIGAAAGGLVCGAMGIMAGSEAESVKEGVLDTLVQVGSVGGVALAASVVVGASLGTGAALSAGTGAGAAVNTVADAVVAIAKVAGVFLPTSVVVKVVVDKTKDSQKSTYEVSCQKGTLKRFCDCL
ncbi:GTPase IMAP family member 7-like isoform X2 [Syngnathus acus]|uniref:GTPase IMAP family member 7-like isoform X2 n=1 Tax=Syngnathus acus TaxID=161584 RepID=UPI0018861285|nr:GTPase IMAP family member 7-like isoform X2 [Syngnathus acus]